MNRHLIIGSLVSLGGILSAAAAFIAMAVAARQMGPTDYGSFAAAYGVLMLAAPISTFGAPNGLLRSFGREGFSAVRWLRPTYRYVVITLSTSIALLILWIMASGIQEDTRQSTWIMLPVVFAYAATEMVTAKFQILNKYYRVSWIQVVAPAFRLTFVLGVAMVSVTNQVEVFAAAFSLASVMALLVSVAAGILKMPVPPVTKSSPSVLEVWRTAWPYGLSAFFHLVYFQSAAVLLERLAGPRETGLYSAAFMLIGAVYLVPTVLFQKYLLPKYHRWLTQDREKLRRVFRLACGCMTVAGLAALLIFALGARDLITLMYGEPFSEAAIILIIMAFGIPFRLVSTSFGAVLLSEEDIRLKMYSMGVVAVFFVASCLILLPHHGAKGAAIVLLLSELLLLLLYLFLVYQRVLGPGAMRGWFNFSKNIKALM